MINEFKMEVSRLYDLWLYNTDSRGASYGEIDYIYSLNKKELKELYNELIDELERIGVIC